MEYLKKISDDLEIEGRVLSPELATKLQSEIEGNYINGVSTSKMFGPDNNDIRTNVFNFDNPLATKKINGIVFKIVGGLIREKRKTYLLYMGDKIIAEVYSIDDAKKVVRFLEEQLVDTKLLEKVSRQTLKDMRYFRVGKNDIDSDGYVTLYHGGKKLPSKLNKDEIFFMTPSYDLAQNYADIRKGEVFTLKVNPEDVNWNQGSMEVEFDKGGHIYNGVIRPLKSHQIKDKEQIRSSYSGYENVSNSILEWIVRTMNYYVNYNKMNIHNSFERLSSDIDYYYMMSDDDSELLDFAQTLKISVEKLENDLLILSALSFDEVVIED